MQQAKKKRMNRIVGRILLVAYFALLIFFVFFSDELGRGLKQQHVRTMNTHPFHEIKRFWGMRHTYGWKVPLMNIGGNILIFVPFGFLIPMSSKNKVTRNFFVVTLLAMMFSGVIEVIQIITKVGAFDIDDIILNTLGAITGYIIFAIAKAIN